MKNQRLYDKVKYASICFRIIDLYQVSNTSYLRYRPHSQCGSFHLYITKKQARLNIYFMLLAVLSTEDKEILKIKGTGDKKQE